MRKTFLSLAILSILALAAFRPATATPDFLGKSPDAVLKEFGVPDDVTFGPDFLAFDYRGKGGKTGHFAFHRDIAIQVPGATFRPGKVKPIPKGKPYSGQPAADAAKLLGSAGGHTVGTATVEFEYAKGKAVTFYGGRAYPR